MKGPSLAVMSYFLYWVRGSDPIRGLLKGQKHPFQGSLPTFGLVGSYSAKVNRDYDSGGFLLLPIPELFVPVLDHMDQPLGGLAHWFE